MNLSDVTDYSILDDALCTYDRDAALAVIQADQDAAGVFRLSHTLNQNDTYTLPGAVVRSILEDGLYPPEVTAATLAAAEQIGVLLGDEVDAATPVSRGGSIDNPSEAPEWVQPSGAHDSYSMGDLVVHGDWTYESRLHGNVWEPTPQSQLWRITPDPGPLPWVQPTGTADAYAIGDVVSHTVPGRDITIWRSNIAGNTTEPGTDGTFDRWWAPLDEAPVAGPQPWRQPQPGVFAPYQNGDRVTHQGQTWINRVASNVWAPGVVGWDAEGSPAGTGFASIKEDDSLGKSRQQELAALRRRKAGRFVADVPGTEENEAWLSGQAPTTEAS